jgi:hypothetical protein
MEGGMAAATLGGSCKSVVVFTGSPKEGALSMLLLCLVVDDLIDGSMGVEYILKAMWITFVFYWWGNSKVHYWGK